MNRKLGIFENVKNLFFKSSTVYSDLEKLIKYFNLEKTAPEILFLGDSVAERISRDDIDKRSLSQMLADAMKGERKLVAISHSAYHMGVYYHLLLSLARMKYKPRLVILPINLRSFSPQWDYEPSWQFVYEINILKQFVESGEIKLLPGHKDNLRDAYEKFDAMPVNYPVSPLESIAEFRLIINSKPATETQKAFRLKQLFIFHYMHRLEIGHSKLRVLENALQLLLRMKIRVLIYITPVNHEAGQRLVNEPFIDALRDNVKTIEKCVEPFLKSNEIIYKDYSTLLRSSCFFHEDNPTEHLNQEGRRELIAQVVHCIRQIYINYPFPEKGKHHVSV